NRWEATRVAVPEIYQALRIARRTLRGVISSSKRQLWMKLCESVDDNIWGMAIKSSRKNSAAHHVTYLEWKPGSWL
ncbi:hypothetical protein, partial [Stutzerimonas stutzeri]|uniref:hypothetical protein n=1 Tax=Stutzerimonas stutzeri TaxID=316 RepID=UPI001BD578E4